MNIKNIFSKTILRGEYETFKYYLYLRKLTDGQLADIVKRERNNRGWCSQRSYFLAALRKVCQQRGIEYCW